LENNIGVTVIVPTLNREDYLYNCLQDLLKQNHRPLEILVVDQSNELPEKIRALINNNRDLISYHKVLFRGLPLARNFGWKNARYDAIVYVDDDIRCPENLVGEHLRALQLPQVGIVAGSITEIYRDEKKSQKTGYFNHFTANVDRGFSNIGEYKVDHAPGGNFAVWRDVAKKIGGFDEKLNCGAALYEETEFCLRAKKAGYAVYFNSNAHLSHLAGLTGGCRVEEVQTYVWALAHNRTILIWRHTKWYQKPIAFAELFRLCLAYSFHYRQFKVLRSLIGAIQTGLKDSYSGNQMASL
jgi:GT2 family glycosyltransferase